MVVVRCALFFLKQFWSTLQQSSDTVDSSPLTKQLSIPSSNLQMLVSISKFKFKFKLKRSFKFNRRFFGNARTSLSNLKISQRVRKILNCNVNIVPGSLETNSSLKKKTSTRIIVFTSKKGSNMLIWLNSTSYRITLSFAFGIQLRPG